MRISFLGFKINLVYLFAGITPIFYYGGIDLRPPVTMQQVAFFQVICLALLASSVYNKWLGLYAFWVCAQALFVETNGFLTEGMFIGMGLMAYHLIYTSKHELKYLPIVLSVVLVINIAFCILQYYAKDSYFMFDNLQSSGLFLLPVYLGMYAALSAPFLLSWNKLGWLLAVICVLFSRSSLCVGGLALGTMFYIYHKHRPIFVKSSIALVILASIFIFLKDMPSGEFSRRLPVWNMVFSKAMRSPYWGYGSQGYDKTLFLEFSSGNTGETKTYLFNTTVKPENEAPIKDIILKIAKENNVDTTRLEAVHFKDKAGVFANLKGVMDELRGRGLGGYTWLHSHNEFLQIFYNQGVIGLLIIGGFILGIFKRFKNASKEQAGLMGSFIALLCIAQVQFPLYLPCVAVLVITLTALLDRSLDREYYID